MDIIFNCPKCNQELEVDAAGAGEEISCPACGEKIRIPVDAPAAPVREEGAPAQTGWGKPGRPMTAVSAAAKVEMHLKVPTRTAGPAESLIAKPLVPLEVAAVKDSDKKLKVKCIRHLDCVEVGHDKFDEVVTGFLGKIGETNLVSITTISYSHVDISSQKLLTDFGVMIVYRG